MTMKRNRLQPPLGLVLTLSILLAIMCVHSAASQVEEVISQAARLEEVGHFKKASALLQNASSARQTTKEEQRQIGFELERLERIRRDFSMTRDELFAELQQSVSRLAEAEFDQWVREGRFDSRVIDGTKWFMSSSVSNLFFRYAELEARRNPPKPPKEMELAKWRATSAIRAAARHLGQPYALPKTFEAVMTVSLKPRAAAPGQEVRAWLPVPRAYPFQTGFEVVASSPALEYLAPEVSPIRAAFFEQKADAKGQATFSLTYRYTIHGVSFDLDPARACKSAAEGDLERFTREAPHVRFTPAMREMAAQIAGRETNVLLRAKRYYDWIGENIKYSYAIEYSTIRNISDYCRARGYGDCGQEALLFITLCRMDGIPARWQSGWNLFPGVKTIHDWAEIYIEPWGWFPVDPYMSIFATRYAASLTPTQRAELRDFYFGGLDQYRMAANSDHSRELSPPKSGHRSDTVDFQRGELDVGGTNLYFDKFSYSLDYKEIIP